MLLDMSSINAVQDLNFEDVPVPEWGGEVRVRTMTGTERDAWEASLSPAGVKGGPDLANLRARLLVKCLVDAQGGRLYDDEAVFLGAKSAGALERLFVVAQRLNGLGTSAVETAEKN